MSLSRMNRAVTDILGLALALVAVIFFIDSAYAETYLVDLVPDERNPKSVKLASVIRNSIRSEFSSLDIKIVSNQNYSVNADLAIAISSKAYLHLLKSDHKYKQVLGFYVDESIQIAGNQNIAFETSVLKQQPDPTLQLLLARQLLPKINHIGLIHRPGSPINIWKQAADSVGIALSIREITNDRELVSSLNSLLDEVDALVGILDEEIYNGESIQNILLSTYRHRKVLIGPSKKFVAVGSLASTYCSAAQYFQQLNEIIKIFLVTKKLPKSQSCNKLSVSINHQVANSLNIQVPSEESIILGIEQVLESLK